MITISRELIRDGISAEVLTACLRRHDALLPELQRLRAYYEGRNPAIMERTDGGSGQTRLPHPFARYIALTAAGYLTGRPIAYEAPGQEAALAALTRGFRETAMDSVDAELAVQAAVYGKGVERIWTDRAGRARSVAVSPEEAFVVYDDTVAHEPLFGLCLTPLIRPDGTEEGTQLEALTAEETLTWRLRDRRTVTDADLVRREAPASTTLRYGTVSNIQAARAQSGRPSDLRAQDSAFRARNEGRNRIFSTAWPIRQAAATSRARKPRT